MASVTEQVAAIRKNIGERKSFAVGAGKAFFGSAGPAPGPEVTTGAVKETLRQVLNRTQMAFRLASVKENDAPNSGLPTVIERVTEIS